jgi:hypothetical protein
MRIESFDRAIALAKVQASVLRPLGYKGKIIPLRDEGRVEFLAHKRGAKKVLHLTFHPGGIESEALEVTSLSQARALIEA